MLDIPETNLFITWIQGALSFIESNIAVGKNVLVSCVYGQSRSAACVIAYVMKFEQIGWEAAFEKVRDARPNIHVNIGFLHQLALWEDMKWSFIGKLQAHAEVLEFPSFNLRRSNIVQMEHRSSR